MRCPLSRAVELQAARLVPHRDVCLVQPNAEAAEREGPKHSVSQFARGVRARSTRVRGDQSAGRAL